MRLQTEFITPDDPVWKATVTRSPHDFYHLPEYAQLAKRSDEEAVAYYARDEDHAFIIPLHLRNIPAPLSPSGPLRDAVSPYGYAGPVSTQGAPSSFVQQAAAAFQKDLHQAGLVTAFVRLHPFLNDPTLFSVAGQVVTHGPTVYLDLDRSVDDIWRQIRRGHRREIIALESRFTVSFEEESWDSIDDFLTCYNDTMTRRDANSTYFFGKKYFSDLKKALGNRAVLCLVRDNKEIACAGIATVTEGLAQYHLSATANKYLPDHPSKLMLYSLALYLRERGSRVFHVGGGLGAQRDSLYAFKSGFSPLEAKFSTWRVIADEVLYQKLVSRSANARESDGQSLHFPAYRA